MNEYQPNKNKQRLFIQSFLFIAGSQHHHLRLAETQRQAEERKSFAEKKKGRRQVYPDSGLLDWGSHRRAS